MRICVVCILCLIYIMYYNVKIVVICVSCPGRRTVPEPVTGARLTRAQRPQPREVALHIRCDFLLRTRARCVCVCV